MSRVVFEKSVSGRKGYTLPKLTEAEKSCRLRIPKKYFAKEPPNLPELSELDVVRHFTNLSQKNFSVDRNYYPLGSCTMKYNPKICEKIAAMDGFASLHPLLPQLRGGGMLTQGALQVIYEMEQLLCEIVGMDAFCLQPMAGAHGELTGIMLIAAYHKKMGNRKTKVLIPDSGHGTNPASASIAGYSVVSISTGDDGCMDMDELEKALDSEVAAVMLTSPNTLGLFNSHIRELADKVHSHNALLYCDGANLNALLGRCRPGDLGFDVMHVNLHKTFASPHGGGGPGSGPVGVKKELIPYLPTSVVVKRDDGTYALEYAKDETIGFIAPFYGNYGVILRAYVYILMLGREGMRRVSENAVLNANYIQARLKDAYSFPYDRRCMHECVLSAERQAEKGVHALDIAKALIDMGFHPPTIYFPLIVKEAMMIEPTETESKEQLDAFIDAMHEIARQADENPDDFKRMPRSTPVGRLDELKATKDMIFSL
ncbi:MAG: aminomethyl-transferring glycine dehydrogenase subunit GcvPB [Lentisphaerae bacterium]|nr:aminomethyl-transferring glycine dehydrogenase subunit GcvPB [Lentisphaerota bacterium]